MSDLQSGTTLRVAPGTVASPSIQVGRPDTGFYMKQDSDGVPNGIGVVIAGVELASALQAETGLLAAVDAAPASAVAATNTLTDGNGTNVNVLTAATRVLTNGNAVAPSDGDKLTIAGKQYTFKDTLTPTEGEVLINTTADAATLNLLRAINHSGTADTDYKCAAANANVSSSTSVVSHAITLTALVGGTAGNALTITQDTGTSFTVLSPMTGGLDADTVVVNGKTYTFKAVTATEGDVLKGASADASLLNLARAINKSGGSAPTDYNVAAANPDVSASASVTSNAITLTARVAGVIGNALTLTKGAGATSLTIGHAATFSTGADGTPGTAGEFVSYLGDLYFCPAGATISTLAAWFKVSSTGV
jgi:hypothetical protein